MRRKRPNGERAIGLMRLRARDALAPKVVAKESVAAKDFRPILNTMINDYSFVLH